MDNKRQYRNFWLRVNYAVARDEHIRKIGSQAFGVFIVIRTYMNSEEVAYPSLRRIAHLSGLSIRTARNEIKKLIEYGWIEVDKPTRKADGKFHNNIYQIIENDLIRSIGQPSFLDEPLEEIVNG